MSPEQLSAFGATDPLASALWAEVEKVVVLHVEQAVLETMERNITNEQRTHAAGGADALTNLHLSLKELRRTALEERGRADAAKAV